MLEYLSRHTHILQQLAETEGDRDLGGAYLILKSGTIITEPNLEGEPFVTIG